MRARQLLEVLAKAHMTPIPAAGIRAVEMLLTETEYADEISPEDLTSTIMRMDDEAAREAKVFAAAHKVPIWRALGIVWFKGRPRGRKRTG